MALLPRPRHRHWVKAWHRAWKPIKTRQPERCLLPDIFILGNPKCGSSTMWDLLVRHPGVVRAVRKEVLIDSRGPVLDEAWYRSRFPHAIEVRALEAVRRRSVRSIDASVSLLDSGHFTTIHRMQPNARHLVLLRNPTDRAISWWHHRNRSSNIDVPIEVALDPGAVDAELLDPTRWREVADSGPLSTHPLFGLNGHRVSDGPGQSMIERGCYVRSLANLFETIPREQVLVLRTEDFLADTSAVWHQVLRHLELDDRPLPDRPAKNVGGYDRSQVPALVRERLDEAYAPWNALLVDFLGRPMWS